MDLLLISVWRPKFKNSIQKYKISCLGQRLIAEYGPNVDFSMESKVYEIPHGNFGFHVRDNASSQNINLMLTSIWKATCKEFINKIKDFMFGTVLIAEYGPNVDSIWKAKCKEFHWEIKDFMFGTALNRRIWT